MGLTGCRSVNIDDYATYKPMVDAVVDKSQLYFYLDLDSPLDLRGEYNSNSEIDHPDIMYVSDGSGVVMASQIFANAFISQSKQESKLRKKQQQANQVLSPYEDILQRLTGQSILPVDNLVTVRPMSMLEATEGIVHVLTKPIYVVSQDESSISLKLALKGYRYNSKNQKTLVYENMIEIVEALEDKRLLSKMPDLDEVSSFVASLRDMYAESIRIAEIDLLNRYPSNAKQKSYKINVGSKARFERGSTMEIKNNRYLIRNLRGWLISYTKKYQ